MSIFDGRQVYGNGFEVVNTRPLDNMELSRISRGKVVSSQYGLSACFFLKSGGSIYIPLSRDTVSSPGIEIDLHKVRIVTLKKDNTEIDRVEF